MYTKHRCKYRNTAVSCYPSKNSLPLEFYYTIVVYSSTILYIYTTFTHTILRSQKINCFETTSDKGLRKCNKTKSLQVTVDGERLKKLTGVIDE